MKKIYKLVSCAKQSLFALALTVFSANVYSQTTIFNYTGGQQTVALAAGTYDINAWGANGGNSGNSRAGIGGYSTGTLNLSSTTTLYINVGGTPIYTGVSGLQPGGYNGGGTGYANATGRAGGGATHIATLTGVLSSLVSNSLSVIIVAGGGGGDQNSGLIGHGGGLTGGGTYPGTQTGSAGGIFGSFGQGGDITTSYGGGGGGGWFGGGGNQNNAGSGGSGYIGGVSNGATIMSGSAGFVTNPDVAGNGRVTITSLCNILTTNVSSSGPGPICTGGSATLTTNAISNYAWSNGATTASIVVSPTVTTTYSLTATSPQNCTASSMITVVVQTVAPTVSAVASSSAVCAGKTLTLTGTGANTYTWTGGVTNATSYTPAATSGYTVTGFNACGTGTAAISVTVNPSPSVFAGVNTPTICSGSSVTFTSGGTATNYVWSAGVVSNTPYFPSVTSDYTLTGTALGCSSVAVVGVTVVASPNIPPAVTPTAICIGSTATLSASGATGYTWNPGPNPFTSTIAVSPPGPTTYTLLRNNGACSTTATISLGVNPLPLVNASGTPNQICAGTGVNLVVLGPITNTWLPGGFTASNFTLFPNNSTCYTVTGSNGNCTASAVVCVTVNTSPPISILSSSNIVCQGATVNFTAVGSATSYTWKPMNSNNVTESLTPPTTTIVTLVGANAAGCTSTVTQLIQVNQLANMGISSNIPVLCSGQTAVISVNNPSTNVTYNWSTGGTGPSISVSPTITTTYSISGTNNNSGCVNTNSLTLSVFISTFSIASPSAICRGETATLTASGPPTSYLWSVPGNPTAPSVTVAPIVTTSYNVTGINGSCQNTVAVTVTVNPLPNVTATVAKGQICKFEVATITGNGATTYSWNTGANSQVLTFTLGVTTTYTLTGIDLNGCSKTTTVTQFVATCIGIEDLNALGNSGLSIYPNPNNGNFTVRSDVSLSLSLINALGQVVSRIDLTENNNKEITVSDLPTGVYFISGLKDGVKVNKKIIIER
jgi:hypothetical protein